MVRNNKPIIALLTDFGIRDWFVASMKAVIKTILPDSDIIDVSHEMPRQDVYAASFALESCYRDFPRDTVFCCVVDPGVGTSRRRIAATNQAYTFIAPDNGLLTGVKSQSETFSCFSITSSEVLRSGPGTTFDGRDVFAPAAAHAAAGMDIHNMGDACDEIRALEQYEAEGADEGNIEGRILYIDYFGNLITNITPDHLSGKAETRIHVKVGSRDVKGLSGGYADTAPGEALAYWGSTGRLEIAVNRGNAAETLNMSCGDSVIALLPDDLKK